MPPIHVDFYLLGKDGKDILSFACHLLEKAYQEKHRVFVYCDNQAQAEHLDELLWTFKPESFIPHNLQGEGPEAPPPIQIGFSQVHSAFNDILLNLSSQVPDFSKRFKRIMEIVPVDEEGKERSRLRYKEYRRMRYQLLTHEVSF